MLPQCPPLIGVPLVPPHLSPSTFVLCFFLFIAFALVRLGKCASPCMTVPIFYSFKFILFKFRIFYSLKCILFKFWIWRQRVSKANSSSSEDSFICSLKELKFVPLKINSTPLVSFAVNLGDVEIRDTPLDLPPYFPMSLREITASRVTAPLFKCYVEGKSHVNSLKSECQVSA